LGVRRE
jgi:hypothetical protein